MEVLDNVGPKGFLCHRCQHVLNFEADRNATGHEQSTRLNDQLKFITNLLPRIDSVHIDECDFDRAMREARPISRLDTHQRSETTALDPNANRPMAVKGLTNLGPQSIAVNISTSEGPTEAEKEAEKARKEKIAQQNALPSWMSNSTVTGASFSNTVGNGHAAVKEESGTDKGKLQSRLVDEETSAQIDDIFERLKAEQAAERAREIEEEEDEDDEDGFEDVPALSKDTANTTPLLKREAPNGTAAMGATRSGSSSEDRQVKRVKVEPEIKKEEDSEEDEDEDELEFEDV